MKRQILVVDDNRSILKLLYHILSKDYDLVIKENGLDALYWLEEGNNPALIISDLEMPNVNGETFIKNLKISGIYKDIPVIVLSGLHNLAEKIKEMNMLVDFMHKPFSPVALKNSISKHLESESFFLA